MGLKDFFNHNHDTTPAASPEAARGWNAVGANTTVESATQNHDREKQAQEDKLRQERKAIGMILQGPNFINTHDFTVSDEDRLAAYDKINAGDFDAQTQSRILRYIKTPDTAHGGTPEQVFQELGTKHGRRILAFVNDIPDTKENLPRISSTEVTSTLQRYPTPIEFTGAAERMMNLMRLHNTPEKCDEYARDLKVFQRQIYGKRYEYYEAFQSLEDKAHKYAEEQDARTEVLNTFHPDTRPAHARQPEQSGQSIEISRLDRTESEKFLREGRIDGDPFILDGKSYNLTPDYLDQIGLNPEYKIQVDGTDIALSKTYRAEGRDAVVAYVRTNKGTKIASYYRSNSQGGWRYLPDYVSSDYPEDQGIEWFGKGYSEESLNLPVATQEALEVISKQPRVESAGRFHPGFILAGTAKRYDSKDEYRTAHRNHTLRGDHYAEIADRPAYELDRLSREKRPPESLDVVGLASPDFNHPGSKFQFHSSIYGTADSEHYPSQNRQLIWTFNRDKSGRAWVGGIEVKSPLSSAGLRTQWAEAGDFGTPLYEYPVMDGGYGDTSDQRGEYNCMWKKYLSRMPIIQRYLAHKQDPNAARSAGPTDAQIAPLADSEHYWAPEAKGQTPTAPQPQKKGFFSRFHK